MDSIGVAVIYLFIYLNILTFLFRLHHTKHSHVLFDCVDIEDFHSIPFNFATCILLTGWAIKHSSFFMISHNDFLRYAKNIQKRWWKIQTNL